MIETIVEKVIDDALKAQTKIVETIDKYRFSEFKIEHAQN